MLTNYAARQDVPRYHYVGVASDERRDIIDAWELMSKVQELGEGLLQRTGVEFAPRWPVV